METQPTEILLKVFSFLPAETTALIVPRVCTRWRKIHTDASLYRHLRFTNDYPSTMEIVHILTLAKYLESLTLVDRDDGTAILKAVGSINPTIKSLKLIRCQGRKNQLEISGNVLEETLSKCPGLEELRFKEAWCSPCKVFSEQNLPKLKSIQPGSSFLNNDTLLTTIATQCTGLEQVRLFSTFLSKSHKTFPKIIDKSVVCLSELHRDSLKTLKLNAFSLTNESMIAIAACSRLTSLSLYHVDSIDDEGICYINQLQHLKKLHIIVCLNTITTKGWKQLFSSKTLSKSLSKLTVRWSHFFGDEAVAIIGQRFKKLRVCNVYACANISTNTQERFRETLPLCRLTVSKTICSKKLRNYLYTVCE